MISDCKATDPFHAQVEAYLRAPGADRKAAASIFWACFEDLRSCYVTYAPVFTPPLTDEHLPASLSSYYLFRQKLHALLEAGSGVSTAVVSEARAMWAAHEICYEQYLRSTARDSVAWLASFSARLQESTRAHMLQLLQREYPDTLQLAATCVSDAAGRVGVADEFWAALPLAHMSDEDITTIERAIVALYAESRKDEREYRGALPTSTDKPFAAEAAATEAAGTVGAAPPAAVQHTQAPLQPAIASRARHNSRGRSCPSRGGRRPRPRRHRRSRSRRSRSRGSRRSSQSSIPRRPDTRRLHAASDALTLRPRTRSRRRR